MGGKSSAPAPPDYGPLIKANEKTSAFAMKLAQEQWQWAKDVYNENKGLMKDTNTSFLKTMEDARIASEEDRARYKEIYQPQEDKLVHDLNTYDTPERRDREVGAAQANVAQQFDAQRDQQVSQLESFGVNPSATRFAAMDIGLRGAEAASKAAAGTGAALSVEDKGRALRSAAIDIGKGYPGSYTAAGQLGVQAGGQAVGGTNQTYQTGAEAMGTGPQWLGGSNTALANWGNTLNNQYNNQLGQFNANQSASSGWGTAAGMIGGMAMKRFGFDDGGAVSPEMSPTHGAVMDDVPAAVNVGEFVVPADTVQWLGEKHFHNLTEKTRKERAEQADQAVPVDDTGVQHYAEGGVVGPGQMEHFPGVMPTPGPPGGGMVPLPRGERPTFPGPGGMDRFPGIMPTPGPPGGPIYGIPPGERPTFPVRPLPGVMPTPGPPGGGMVPLPGGERPGFPGGLPSYRPDPRMLPTPGPPGGGWIPGPRDRFTPIHLPSPIPGYQPPGGGTIMPISQPSPIPGYQPPGGGRPLPISMTPPIPHYGPYQGYTRPGGNRTW